MHRKMAGVTETALVLGGWSGKAMGREAGPASKPNKGRHPACLRPEWDTLQLGGQNTATDTT